MTPIYLVATERTAIGSFGGSLRDADPGSLGSIVFRAVLPDAWVAPERGGQGIAVIFERA